MMVMTALRAFISISLNVWNGCRFGTERAARTFVLLVCLNWAVLFAINAVSGRNRKLVYTHHNADGGCSLIFIWWMYGMGVVLALGEQCVRLYCLSLTRDILVIDIIWGRNFTRTHTTMAVLRRSLSVECMRATVPFCPWTNSAYVLLLRVRLNLWCYWLSMQYEVTLMCCPNTLQWRRRLCLR